MAGVNRVILVGNLGKDPEVKYSQNTNKPYCRFTLATTDKVSGEEKTEWHNIICFDRTAEIARDYLSKGRMVYIEGRIQTRKYQDNSGQERSITEIIVNNLTMLGGRRDAGDDFASQPAPRAEQAPRQMSAAPAAKGPGTSPRNNSFSAVDDDPFSGREFNQAPTEDDIPF